MVWFGETLPDGAMEHARRRSRNADVLIVAGTSAQVYPAAGLIPLAIKNGATVIEINPEEQIFQMMSPLPCVARQPKCCPGFYNPPLASNQSMNSST